MSKEYLRRFVSDEKHIRHVAMEMAASHLEDNADEEYGAFYEPLVGVVRKLAKVLREQADALQKTCICCYPDDEAIEVPPRYVSAHTVNPDLPINTTDELNEQPGKWSLP